MSTKKLHRFYEKFLKRESKLGIQSAQKLTKLLKKCHKVYKKAKGLEKSQDFEKLPWKP